MNRTKSYKVMYLGIAFAIFWISFASIIQFHISKIHGEDLTATVVFVKTADQHSLVKKSKVIQHPDLNAGLFTVKENESNTFYIRLQKTLVQLEREPISHLFIEVHCLRGPPSLYL